MLELIEQKNFDELIYFILVRVGIILLCWLFMVLSNIVDFWSGTTTAKALGKPIMSHGFRRTITKIGDYVRVMFFALMFDILGSLFGFYVLPFASLLSTAAIICIEGRSVLENSRLKKAHAAQIPEVVKDIVNAASTEEGLKVLRKIGELYKTEEHEHS